MVPLNKIPNFLEINPTRINTPIAITAPGVEYPVEANRFEKCRLRLLNYFDENPSMIERITVVMLATAATINVLRVNLNILISKK